MTRCAICKGPLGTAGVRWYAEGKRVCMRDAQSKARAAYAHNKAKPLTEKVFLKVLGDYLDSKRAQ